MYFYSILRSQSRAAGATSAFFTPYGGSIYRGQEKHSMIFKVFLKIFLLELEGRYLKSELNFEDINIAFALPFRFILVKLCGAHRIWVKFTQWQRIARFK